MLDSVARSECAAIKCRPMAVVSKPCERWRIVRGLPVDPLRQLVAASEHGQRVVWHGWSMSGWSVACLFVAAALAPWMSGDEHNSAPLPSTADLSKFNFVRGEYDSEGGMGEAYYAYDGRVWQRWETDTPAAEENLLHRLAQLTRIYVNRSPSVRRFTARDLGDFPLLWISDPGWMVLSGEERAALARYLEDGGMIWVDDFWGDAEWQQFANLMTEILQGRQWRDITPSEPIFHIVFDLNEMPQIPALPFASPGASTFERNGGHKFPMGSDESPHLRGWFDDDGRLMVVATHNTDLGDGFEREAFGQWYFETFSTKAYMLGVNIITYAITH